MPAKTLTRPSPTEYAEFYAGYVDAVSDGDVFATLRKQIADTLELLRTIGEDRAGRGYAPGKWTIKEVVGHIVDVERVFAYRALCFARAEAAPQPGFDQDAYVATAQFNRRTLASLSEELERVRAATVALFEGFGDEVWERGGMANDVPFTVRALPYIIAGHEAHHVAVIRERYL